MLAIECHFQAFLNAVHLGIRDHHFHPRDTLQQAQGTTAEVDAAGQNEQKLEKTFQEKNWLDCRLWLGPGNCNKYHACPLIRMRLIQGSV